jgi:hypothetical protein
MDEIKPSTQVPVLRTGQRIHITTNSCSGKSTAGERLAYVLGVPFIELDALRDITLFLIPSNECEETNSRILDFPREL